MNKYKIIIAIVALLVFVACSTEKSPTPPHEFKTSPLNNPSQISKIEEKLKESEKDPSFLSATVTRIIDGDTVDVKLSDESTDRVRLLGVDTPEIRSSNKTGEYGGITDESCLRQWGLAAKDYAYNLLHGESINLISDPVAGNRGTYDRLLAYVEINGSDFSKLLIENGLARAASEWPSTRVKNYTKLQEIALSNNKGLWSCAIENSRPKNPSTGHPADASALCKNGTYSYSENRKGTCSNRGGVKEWLGINKNQ